MMINICLTFMIDDIEVSFRATTVMNISLVKIGASKL